MTRVVSRFGATGDPNADPLVPPGDETGYHPAFDRGTLVGPNPWDMGPADDSIDLFIGIFGVANQFGHSCEGPAQGLSGSARPGTPGGGGVGRPLPL